MSVEKDPPVGDKVCKYCGGPHESGPWWDCPKNDYAPEFILKGDGWPGKKVEK